MAVSVGSPLRLGRRRRQSALGALRRGQPDGAAAVSVGALHAGPQPQRCSLHSLSDAVAGMEVRSMGPRLRARVHPD